jgi:hypothetical protein
MPHFSEGLIPIYIVTKSSYPVKLWHVMDTLSESAFLLHLHTERVKPTHTVANRSIIRRWVNTNKVGNVYCVEYTSI